ncbi:hypothetical protein EMCRGX_G013143 [Ephydatia muelleri]
MLAKPKVRKEPVMANILKAMVEATGPEPPLSDVSSHHPHLYTVEEDCAPAKGDEDILYLHTGQDQGSSFALICIFLSMLWLVRNLGCKPAGQQRVDGSYNPCQWHAGPTQLLALGSIGVELVVLICIGYPILLTRLTQDGRAVVMSWHGDQEDQEQYLDTISNNHIP